MIWRVVLSGRELWQLTESWNSLGWKSPLSTKSSSSPSTAMASIHHVLKCHIHSRWIKRYW